MPLKAALAATVLVAVAAIAHSWTVFSQTVDEPAHIAAGVEWIEAGRYTLDLQHPPLARIAAGIGPVVRGAGYEPLGHWMTTGNAILYGNGAYLATLASARAGTLLFFLLGGVVVFAWSRELYGSIAAIAAVVFYALQPTVLAHASLATTDMAAAATIVAALWTWSSWLSRPSAGRAALLGLAAGAALASKFSAIAFLPPAMLAMFLAQRPRMTKRHLSIVASAAMALAVVLMAYRFQPGFLEGIGQLRAHDREGHPSYLFGEVRRQGWWFYFPVALWFKTTLAMLAAFAWGGWTLWRDRRASPGEDGNVGMAPFLAFAAILAIAMTSRISIGVRHVLPLYPLMAMVGGYAVSRLPRNAAAALIALQLGSFALAHPDHLAYFNLTAGRDPSRILLDSNLDWGQDLLRLEEAAARHRIDDLGLVWFGSADPRKHRLPPLHAIPPFTPSKGWIAISEMQLKDVGARGRPRGAWDWLKEHEPVERVGKSILLYRVR